METRFAPRANLNLKIVFSIDEERDQKFSISKGDKLEGELISISVLGISMFSKFYLPKGLCIKLEIDGRPFHLEQPMSLKGEIRYCKQTNFSKYRYGVKFIDISNEYKKNIAEFICGRR